MSLDYTYIFYWDPNDDWRGSAAPTAATLLDGMVERGEIPSGKALVSENRIMVWRCDKHGLSPGHWMGLRPTQVLACNELDPFEVIWPKPAAPPHVEPSAAESELARHLPDELFRDYGVPVGTIPRMVELGRLIDKGVWDYTTAWELAALVLETFGPKAPR